jgi:hypothetical protein
LTGSLLDFNAADILQLIKLQQKEGVLEVRDRDRHLTLSFREGNIVSAERSGGRVDAVLRQRLARDGDLSVDALTTVGKRLKAGESIDTALMAVGIPGGRLAEYVDDYLRDTVLALFTWSKGTYRFEVCPPREMLLATSPAALNTSTLLMDATSQMGPVEQLSEQLGGLGTVFGPISSTPPDTDSAWLWPWLDGRRNVWDLIDAGNGGVQVTLDSLKDLLDGRLIEPVVAPAEVETASKPSLPKRRHRHGHRAAGILVSALCCALIVACGWLFVSAPPSASEGTMGEVMSATWSYRDHKVRQALMAYRMVHGQYPESLSGLTREGMIGDPNVFNGMDYLKAGKGYTLHAS